MQLHKIGFESHMDYVNDVLNTFLGLELVLLSVRESESSQIPSKNILICVPKMNQGLMDLERHKGE